MQRTSLSHDDLAKIVRRAHVARMQFLRESIGGAMMAMGWSALAFGLGLLLIAGFGSSPRQVLENTALMEQLATKLDRMEKIAPGTAGTIAELLRRPDYDCQEARCVTVLERRNAAARLKLERALAKHPVPAALVATK